MMVVAVFLVLVAIVVVVVVIVVASPVWSYPSFRFVVELTAPLPQWVGHHPLTPALVAENRSSKQSVLIMKEPRAVQMAKVTNNVCCATTVCLLGLPGEVRPM